MINDRKKMRWGLAAGSILLLGLFLAAGVYFRMREPVTPQDITVKVTAQDQTVSLKLWHNYYDGKEYLFLPSFCDGNATLRIEQKHRLFADWDGKRCSQWHWIDEVGEGTHSLKSGAQQFTVEIMYSQKVPSLFLTTESGSLAYIEAEKGNGEPGTFKLVEENGSVRAEGGLSKMRSRGNASFMEDKKPYQINLEEPIDLLGSGSAEKYILLANRQDQSLVRNAVMYGLAADSGMEHVSALEYVDLYVNGEYRGSYQLADKLEVAKNRIDIISEDDVVDTGYMVELEYMQRLDPEDYGVVMEKYFISQNNQLVVLKNPKNPSDAQVDYMADCFDKVEKTIDSGEFDPSLMDLEGFARKYVIEELGKNLDAMYSSLFFYKYDSSVSDVLYAGPLWDMDKTLGNPLIERSRAVNFQDPMGIYAGSAQPGGEWWYRMYTKPVFYAEAVRVYEDQVEPQVQRMLDRGIDSYRDQVWASARMDYYRWDTFEDFKYGEELAFEDEFQAEIDNVKEFLRLRRDFLHDVWVEGRTYNRVLCDPGDGDMPVSYIEAVEGRALVPPRDPKLEGYRFDHWVREDTGEVYDFDEIYDGEPFTLKAVYVEKE